MVKNQLRTMMEKLSTCLPENSASSRRKTTTRTNPQIGITTINSMILMLTIIFVLDMVNKVISKLIAPTLKARRKDQARNLKRRVKLKEPTLLGKTLMFLPLAHHQMKMKRQTCA